MSLAQGASFSFSLSVLVFCTNLNPVSLGRILIPGPPLGSRWAVVNKVAAELVRAGHEVTMLVTEGTEDSIRDRGKFSLLTTRHPDALRYYKQRANKRVSLTPSQGVLRLVPEDLYSALSYVLDHAKLYELFASECEATFQQGVLNGTEFDVVLSDFLSPCAVILARHLGRPVVSLARGTPGGYDLTAAGVPMPPAYVPQLGLTLTDDMTFLQRLENVLVQLVTSSLTGSVLLRPFDRLAREQTGVSVAELLASTDLWLRHTDPLCETPRPVMPNMVYIGGITAERPKPLTQELEESLAKVAGENIAVVSFGSMIDHFDADLAEVLSTALGRLPYKVVWRYRGPSPRHLGNNTVLLPWLPQNDLLGDRRTRLFVTHGGASGVQEAQYHGVPIVGVPLFRDQFSNLARVEALGTGRAVRLGELTADSLHRALQDVTNNHTYRENARRLSRLYRDQPETPMQRAVWWISHVIRHGGLPHIRSRFEEV
ncbi:PREDICTED: UDP-glucuronosyltransferase 1-2-like [Branchiostoma belcheri]|uniref:UDP-glucuronosyltransferase 1-2-like n=1 Tax=Branchiostoma belcheri TaxID=7741 RepID=A0A6P4Y8J8_BRABE|nr:PREDICTED: UDP-glucuronosyltransferase 1-2-like [Branchiostoma belcheri]